MQTPELRTAAPAAEIFTDTYDDKPEATSRGGRRQATRAGAIALSVALAVTGAAGCKSSKKKKNNRGGAVATATAAPKKVTEYAHDEAYTIPKDTRVLIEEIDATECVVVGAGVETDGEGDYYPAELQGSKKPTGGTGGGSKKRDTTKPKKENQRSIRPGEDCEAPEVQVRVCEVGIVPDAQYEIQEGCASFDVRTEIFQTGQGEIPELWVVFNTRQALGAVADRD